MKDISSLMYIVFSSDNNFAQHLCVAMYSLLLYNQTPIHIYVLDGGISDTNKEKIRTSLNKFKNYELDFISIDGLIFKDFKEIGFLSKASYFKLILPDLFPTLDRILYLDCDILIQGDLGELYDSTFNNNSLVAARDSSSECYEAIVHNLDIKDCDFCFNAGVILLNLVKIRTLNITTKMVEFAIVNGDKLLLADQDVLNYFFVNDRKQTSLKRNANHNFFIRSKNQFDFIDDDEFNMIKNHPKIIHFTGPKPWWCGYVHPFRDQYFLYLQETEFKDFTMKINVRGRFFNKLLYLYLKFASYLPKKYFALLKKYLSRLIFGG